MGDVSVSQVPNKMSNEKYNLCSNNFSNTAVSTIQNLVTDTEYTDVTLVSDDRRKIKAHKVILASASQFFREILPEISSHNPVLFLKGIEHSELLAIIRFVYVGTTEVAQDNLDKFMKAAQDLQIEGLQEKKSNKDSMEYPDQYGDIKNISDFEVGNDYKKNENGLALYQETDEYSTDNWGQATVDEYHSLDRYNTKGSNNQSRYKEGSHMGVRFKCDQCEREFSRKDTLQNHVKSKHEGKRYSCDKCGSEFGSPTSLCNHRARMHK